MALLTGGSPYNDIDLESLKRLAMQLDRELKTILDDVLSMGGRAHGFNTDSPLLGAIPELDSMAVVSLITAIEERFGVSIADDEIEGSIFATFGDLLAFVEQMTAR